MSTTVNSLAERLKDIVIINKSVGVGKIVNVTGDPLVAQVDINHATALPYYEDSLVGRIVERMSNEVDSMSWTVRVDHLIDDPEWILAPRQLRMGQINNFLVDHDSIVVLPTTNPRQSHLAKREIMSNHMNNLASGFRLDDEFLNIAHHIVAIVDTQFSWFLLKGRERYHDYQDRIEAMVDDMSVHCAWQNHIFPAVPAESRERVEEILSILASVNAYYNPRMTLRDAALFQVQSIEGRIASYRDIAEEFIRNRITKPGKRTPQAA